MSEITSRAIALRERIDSGKPVSSDDVEWLRSLIYRGIGGHSTFRDPSLTDIPPELSTLSPEAFAVNAVMASIEARYKISCLSLLNADGVRWCVLSAAVKQDARNLSDGPIANGFRWNGQDHHGLNGTARLLVGYLWSAEYRAATFKELAGPVWGDREKPVTVNMVGNARKRANEFFLDNGIPFEVSIKQATVKLFSTK